MHRLTTRITTEQYDLLAQKAHQTGVSFSQVVRDLIEQHIVLPTKRVPVTVGSDTFYLTPALVNTIKTLCASNQWITAIKEVRAEMGLGLAVAKGIVDMYRDYTRY